MPLFILFRHHGRESKGVGLEAMLDPAVVVTVVVRTARVALDLDVAFVAEGMRDLAAPCTRVPNEAAAGGRRAGAGIAEPLSGGRGRYTALASNSPCARLACASASNERLSRCSFALRVCAA